MQHKARNVVIFSMMVIAIAVFPRWICGRDADDFFAGDVNAQRELALGQARWVRSQLTQSDFRTGYDLFDGEWYFGTYMMSVLGLGQIALAHPELAKAQLPVIEICLDKLVSEDVRKFDHEAWDEDALAALTNGRGHAAYLGYLNLALGMHRALQPVSRFAELHDAITAALTQRLTASKSGLVETYPGQAFPVDNMALVASIALHAKTTGSDRPQLVTDWVRLVRARYIEPRTGLLIQAAAHDTGAPYDKARGSGTALGAYFISFADAELARDMHLAVRDQLGSTPFGFAAVREYAEGDEGRGDIDSGPLLFGYSISATGFSLGSARAVSDREHFLHVFRTANLFGALYRHDEARDFVGGGPLGNAIMLAMLTAAPIEGSYVR